MNEMLLWIQIQKKNTTIQLASEAVNIVELMETNFDLFRERIKLHNLKINILVPVTATILTDRRLLNSILYNLITNAIKYTENGVVQIESFIDQPENQQVSLLIRSQSNTTAISTAPAIATNVSTDNEAGSNISPHTNGPSRQIGLQLVKSFAEMLNISVSFDNTAEGIFIVKISGIRLVKK